MDQRLPSAETLFEAACDLPAGKRTAFLDQSCGQSTPLRLEVEEMLREQEAHEAAARNSGPLPPGATLGRYSIAEELGAGGMGRVYRARDERLERTVAIKVLSSRIGNGVASRQRFLREGLALAKLSHPNIASVYDVGEQDALDYIVMECVPGRSLASHLDDGPLSLREATNYLVQIAEALSEAHEQGIVHRDLKPPNVIITPKGQVKVLDFGIAKLLDPGTSELNLTETRALIGTPRYMSPEQAQDLPLDGRSDLWSLGVLYYEALTLCPPFNGRTHYAILGAILQDKPEPLSHHLPEAPELAGKIVARLLQKDPADRYQSASELIDDAHRLLAELDGNPRTAAGSGGLSRRATSLLGTAMVAVLVAVAVWFNLHAAHRTWVRDHALPEITTDLEDRKPLAAALLIAQAQRYLPNDPDLLKLAQNTKTVSITSSPAGSTVQIQDYRTPSGPWKTLGVTPLTNVAIPKGYFRWKVAKPGLGEMLVAPETSAQMNFPLEAFLKAPEGMVPVPATHWQNFVAFLGWLGPVEIPAFYIDRYEVTNRDFQRFVDVGGYNNPTFWPQRLTGAGRDLTFAQAIAEFRDTTGRPGPFTWVGGHYPEGKGDLPVAGVSYFEAAAYAAFAGKSLPAIAQWIDAAPEDATADAISQANISLPASSLVSAGTFNDLGAFGTYDMAGNVREWTANPVDDGLHMLMGGSWRSPAYIASEPEASSPFDRSDTNGIRCVHNTGPLPAVLTAHVQRVLRDFSRFKPANDEVFAAYKLLYAYPNTPLNASSGGIVRETADWREEKVAYDTGYRGERMSAYLFLPKNIPPPFQTVLFFPSARILYQTSNNNGLELGDMQFIDYILQSGRAVLYPIYEGTYERKVDFHLPSGAQSIEITTDRFKDTARSLDFLDSRPDLDHSKIAYLGVSMGSAEGIIYTTLLQDRLQTAVFLDGGFFLDPPPPGGDQADFASRMKKPVLMVNGRYDYVFSEEKSQEPFFKMLGTPAADKRHVLFDTPHDVSQQHPQLARTVLDWLDHYLGPVPEKP
jgi:serine/threonine protein kinase/formylglycine-generating enzyme required for sulfatase activity/dienelactone hydrolase